MAFGVAIPNSHSTRSWLYHPALLWPIWTIHGHTAEGSASITSTASNCGRLRLARCDPGHPSWTGPDLATGMADPA